MTSRDEFGYWPKSEAYRTPKPEIKAVTVCGSCSQRHIGATWWCLDENRGGDNADERARWQDVQR